MASLHGYPPTVPLLSISSGLSFQTLGFKHLASLGILIGGTTIALLFYIFFTKYRREWAILVPAWTIITVLLTYFGYYGLAFSHTPAIDDVSTIFGKRARTRTYIFSTLISGNAADTFAVVPTQKSFKNLGSSQTDPELFDLPLMVVNKALYTRKSM